MSEVPAKQLGQLFRQARTKKRWSLRVVEKHTGIPHTWIRNLESGHYKTPAPDRLAQLADLFGVPLKSVDRLAQGNMSHRLPDLRLYLRAKYDLTSDEVDQVEDCLRQVHRQREQQTDAEEKAA